MVQMRAHFGLQPAVFEGSFAIRIADAVACSAGLRLFRLSLAPMHGPSTAYSQPLTSHHACLSFE